MRELIEEKQRSYVLLSVGRWVAAVSYIFLGEFTAGRCMWYAWIGVGCDFCLDSCVGSSSLCPVNKDNRGVRVDRWCVVGHTGYRDVRERIAFGCEPNRVARRRRKCVVAL